MQFQWQDQAGSSDLYPNPDWTRRWLSDGNQWRRHWMVSQISLPWRQHFGPRCCNKRCVAIAGGSEWSRNWVPKTYQIIIVSQFLCGPLPDVKHRQWRRRQHQWWNIVLPSLDLSLEAFETLWELTNVRSAIENNLSILRTILQAFPFLTEWYNSKKKAKHRTASLISILSCKGALLSRYCVRIFWM